MKKITALLLSVTLAIALLAACGAGGADNAPMSADSRNRLSETSNAGGSDYMMDSTALYSYAQMPAPDAEPPIPMPDMPAGSTGYDGGSISYDDVALNRADEALTAAPVSQSYAEKIIYSYYASIETIEFDKTLEMVQEMIDAHGAFIENSSIQGSNYETSRAGWPRFRTAYYTIRVPVGQLNTVTGKLDVLGNVITRSSNAENITAQFLDNESRLKSLRMQEERLLDMLGKAEDVPDLLTIETTLADVRYQIERITTTLNHWQQQVDFSTLTLSISEVEEYQEPPPPVNRSYWERMGDGLVSTLRGVGRFFTSLFMWLVVSAPVLVIIAVIAIVVIIIIKRNIRKAKAKQEEKLREYKQAYEAGNRQQQPQQQDKE